MMILFVVDEGKERYHGRAVRASILAHTCLMQGLEVSFVCANQDVYDCLIRGGSSRVHLTDESRLVTDSALVRPSLLVWDGDRPLTRDEVMLLHQHDALVIEFDASDGKSYADEVVNGFEPTLRNALGHQYRLAGPGYFVVDKCFINAKEWRRASSFVHNGPDLFICFHGTESDELLQSTLEILAEIPACRSVQMRAMTGVDGKRGRAIQRNFSSFKNLQVYAEANAALAAQLMRFSRLGIISFGSTLVEAIAAELPVLLINSTEADEERAAEVLKGVFAGVGKTFGYSSQIDWDAFRRELACLLERPREIERMQIAAHRLVDGQGAQRIARYIHTYLENRSRRHGSLSLQDASLQDAALSLSPSWVRGKEPQNIIPLSR
jgi:spore coat polysaccharide biosynthesis predicted glycosyltransferase SpsG